MNIGAFSPTQEGGYQGYIKTLTLSGKAMIRPVEQKRSESTPDFRVILNGIEVGVAWTRMFQEENPYLRVNIDDPSLPSAIWANMTLVDKYYQLIWSR